MINEIDFFTSVEFDKSYLKKLKKKYVIGIDEVGMGAMAGPVMGSAIILNLGKILDARIKYYINNIEYLLFPTDSKKLSEDQRSLMVFFLKRFIVATGTGMATVSELDTLNDMTKSRALAWERALNLMFITTPGIRPEECIILSDAFKIDFKNILCENIIQGDSKSVSIGAASILAKVTRDTYMMNLHRLNPEYNWIQNKGYHEQTQIEAIIKKGPSIHHRSHFSNVKEATKKYYESKSRI